MAQLPLEVQAALSLPVNLLRVQGGDTSGQPLPGAWAQGQCQGLLAALSLPVPVPTLLFVSFLLRGQLDSEKPRPGAAGAPKKIFKKALFALSLPFVVSGWSQGPDNAGAGVAGLGTEVPPARVW